MVAEEHGDGGLVQIQPEGVSRWSDLAMQEVAPAPSSNGLAARGAFMRWGGADSGAVFGTPVSKRKEVTALFWSPVYVPPFPLRWRYQGLGSWSRALSCITDGDGASRMAIRPVWAPHRLFHRRTHRKAFWLLRPTGGMFCSRTTVARWSSSELVGATPLAVLAVATHVRSRCSSISFRALAVAR